MRSGPRIAVALALVLLAVVAVVKWVPWLDTRRDVELSSPTSPPLSIPPSLVTLKPGDRLCIPAIDLGPSYREAHLFVNKPSKFSFTVSAPGYRGTTFGSTPGDETPVALPVKPPPHDAIGTACVRNVGRHRFYLWGTVEPRTQARPVSFLNGKALPQDVALSFWSGKPTTVWEDASGAISRMSVLAPVGTWFFWLLLVLVAIGVPAAVIYALARSLRPSGEPGA
ncbi:MAG TPA: hypothetical protein VGI67_20555 [Thermoleophilaceae bacterium]